jgi:drug/metabolite transporter (DMT)-like permease
MTKIRSIAYVLAVIHASIVGFSFLFTKIAIVESSPLDTLAARFTISFAILAVLAVFKWIKVDVSIEAAKILLPLALLNPILFFGFQTFGLKYSQSSDAGIIFALSPIFTMLLAAYFLKEKTNFLQKLSIILSVAGVLLIFIIRGSSISPGEIVGSSLLFISCLATAGYTTMTRSLRKEFTPVEITFFTLGIGCLVFNAASFVSHMQKGTMTEIFTPWSSGAFIVSILFLGILATLVTIIISTYIVSIIKASQMSVFSNLSTVISIVAGAIILNEKITGYDVIGSVLIVLGVLGTNYFSGRKINSDRSVKKEEQKPVLANE